MTSPGRSMLFPLTVIFFLHLGESKARGDGVLFEYFPSSPKSSSDVLKVTLANEDFSRSLKILPDKKDVILELYHKQEISLLYPVVEPGPISLSVSPCFGALKWELFWRPHSPTDLEIVMAGTANSSDPLRENADSSSPDALSPNEESKNSNRSRRNLNKKGLFGIIKTIESNFTHSDMKDPLMKYVYRNGVPILEVELNRGEGRDPWHYQKLITQPGLYLIKIRSLSEQSKIHALASRNHINEIQRKREMDSFKVKENFEKHSITLSWGSRRNDGNTFCLGVSRHKFYSSLCAARDLQRDFKTLPANLVDGSLILGCTPNTYYSLPATPNIQYYVSVWQQGSLIPLLQATLKAKAHRKFQRLKPGVMVPFTLTAGGQVTAKFIVRRTGKKLHVAAVSCYGGVKVLVLAGKERVAAAKGREALHLAVHHAPKAKLTIKVSPQPPIQALYRVHLVVSHSARKLPIPRLPKSVIVKVIPLGCSSAIIRWSKSPGGATYCIVLQRHPSGRPPEIRPPLQCGWEEVIRRPEYFQYLDCFNGTKARRQEKLLKKLPLNQSFLVNVLVRHPVTGKTLTLSPTMLNLPTCSQIDNRTTQHLKEKTKYNYKQIF